jgi:hypothetical protein
MSSEYHTCPNCSGNIKIKLSRWPGKTICPKCTGKIYVFYELIDYENIKIDLHELLENNNNIFDSSFLDYFESEL